MAFEQLQTINISTNPREEHTIFIPEDAKLLGANPVYGAIGVSYLGNPAAKPVKTAFVFYTDMELVDCVRYEHLASFFHPTWGSVIHVFYREVP